MGQLKDEDEKLSALLEDEKSSISSNEKELAGQKAQVKRLTEKLEKLYQLTEEMTHDDEFTSQVEKIHQLVSMSNNTVISSVARKF